MGVIDFIGPSVAAAANLGSTLLTNRSNESINKRNLEWQSAENEKSRLWSEKMVNEQNLYNTPSAQKARMLEAGLNPWLADSGATSSPAASSAPAQTSHSAPASLPMQSPQLGSDVLNGLQVALNSKSVDANSANQTAQSVATLVKAAIDASRNLGQNAGKVLLDKFLPLVSGSADFKNGWESRLLYAQVTQAETKADLETFEFKLTQYFEPKERQAALWQLDQAYSESVYKCGLWSSLGKLNDSNIARNDAEIKLLGEKLVTEMTEQVKNRAIGKYYNEYGITEHDVRQYLVKRLQQENSSRQMDLIEQYAGFSQNKKVRDFQKTEAAQNMRLASYNLDAENNFFIKLEREILGAAGSVPSSKSSYDNVRPVWQKPLPRVVDKRNYMTPTGYKGQRTEYFYYKPEALYGE